MTMRERTLHFGGLTVSFCSGAGWRNLELDWTTAPQRARRELAELRSSGLVPPEHWDGYAYTGPNEAGHVRGCACQDCWELTCLIEVELADVFPDQLCGRPRPCAWCGEKADVGGHHRRDGWVCLREQCIDAELSRRAPRGLAGIAAAAVGVFLDDEEHPAFDRADGNIACQVCGKAFRDHPVDHERDWLRILCTGRLVKL